MKDIAIYFHIPFCEKRCMYCDFYSTLEFSSLSEKFEKALLNELTWQKENRYDSEVRVDSIYFGGGTPNIYAPEFFHHILNRIRKLFNVKQDVEITVEMNPEFAQSESDLKQLRREGINRISLGVQSLQDEELTLLSRIHNKQTAVNAMQIIRDAGFSNLSVDLIYNIPGQTLAHFEDSFQQVLSFSPEHISAYSLTREEHTPFDALVKQGLIKENSEEMDEMFFRKVHSMIEAEGYEHYEISSFGKSGFQSRHNSKYWSGEDYIGLGPSAHSKIGNKRFWHSSDLNHYLRKSENNDFREDDSEIITTERHIEEVILTRLRTLNGIGEEDLNSLYFNKVKVICEEINDKLKKTYFTFENNRIKCKFNTWLLLDSLVQEIVKNLEPARDSMGVQ